MNQPLHDLSESSLIGAIEENTRAFLLALGRLGGGEERDEPGIHWIIGGSPLAYHNCVVRAALTTETVDEAIGASRECLRRHQVAGSWHVGPSMTPAHLGERLLAHGFTAAGSEPGMAADLTSLNEQIASPPSFAVSRVQTEQELRRWTATLGKGFGEGEVEANWVGDMYHRAGLDEQGAWRHYLGWWQETPVATASLFLSAGVAGVYFVFTLPEVRRQGIGAALTLAALQEARQVGYRIGVLGSSAMGYPVYQRLGFQQYCHLDLYEWAP